MNAEDSSSHIAVICYSCLTCQTHLLILLQLHSRMILAVTRGLPFWNLLSLPEVSYPLIPWESLTQLWVKIQVLLPMEVFSCMSWIIGHSLFNSQHRQEKQCSDCIYWLVCMSDSLVDWKIFRGRCIVGLHLCNPSMWQSAFHMVCARKVFTEWMNIFCDMSHKHDFIQPIHLLRFLMFIPFRSTFLYISDICLKIFF